MLSLAHLTQAHFWSWPMMHRRLNGTPRSCHLTMCQLRTVLSWQAQIVTLLWLTHNFRALPGSRRKRRTLASRLLDLPQKLWAKPSRSLSAVLNKANQYSLKILKMQSTLQSLQSMVVRSSREVVPASSRWVTRNLLLTPSSIFTCTLSCPILTTRQKSKLSAHWLTSLSQKQVLKINFLPLSSRKRDPISLLRKRSLSPNKTSSRLP